MLDQFAAQLFLSRPLLTLNQLQLALNTVQEGESEPVRWTEENVNDLIAGLKVSLEPLGFDLIRAFDHQTGVPIYTLVNQFPHYITVPDSIKTYS
jgi:hypothetical protein